MLNGSNQAHKSSAYESLSKLEQAELDTFIRGLIQGACAFTDEFTVSDIVGGKFTHWKNTPLHKIYLYHKHRKDCDNPVAESGKDMGRIFKYVMAKDKFRNYTLIGTEQRQFPINRYRIEY